MQNEMLSNDEVTILKNKKEWKHPKKSIFQKTYKTHTFLKCIKNEK